MSNLLTMSAIGEIQMFAFSKPIDGISWIPCDGRLLAISQFPELYSVINTTYGGDGITTFAVPDLQFRVPLGAGKTPSGYNYASGATGGVTSVTVTTDQLPPHTHNVVASSQAPASPNSGILSQGLVYATPPASVVANMSPSAIESTGGGGAHNNVQPYITVFFAICNSGQYPG